MKNSIVILVLMASVFGEGLADEIDCTRRSHTNPRECCLDPMLISPEVADICQIHLGRCNQQSSSENMLDHPFGGEDRMLYERERDEEDGEGGKRIVTKVDFSGELSGSDELKETPFVRLKRSFRENGNDGSSSEEDKYHGRRHHRRHHHHNQKYHGSDEDDEENHHHRPRHHHGRKHHHHHRQHRHWGHRMHKLTCYMECVFNETGIMNSAGTVNMDNVKLYLSQLLTKNQQFLPIVEEAFDTCVNTGAEIRKRMKEMPVLPMLPNPLMEQQPACKPWAGMLMRCVKTQVFVNCPAEKFRGDDNKCNNLLEHIKNCPKPNPFYFSSTGARFSHN